MFLHIKRPDGGVTQHNFLVQEGVFQSIIVDGQEYFFAFERDTVKDKARSLAAVLQEAIAHGQAEPSHGPNCTCMDPLIRELKAQIESVLPEASPKASEQRFAARWRIGHLLHSIARWM